MLAVVAVMIRIADDYPAEFYGGFITLLAVFAAYGGWADAEGAPLLRRAGRALAGVGAVIAVCAFLAAAAVVQGLLGSGESCAPHRPYDC
jgi:hypothetical protein